MIKPKSIRFWRRLMQLGVLLAFIAIPVLNWKEINVISGNFLSFNFGAFTVVDPMAALQVFLGSLSIPAETLLGAGIILLLAVVMGPVFCSWVCPFGFLSELIHGSRPAEENSPPISARPYKIKLAVSATGLAGVLLFAPFPILNQISMPGWYSRIIQHLVMYGQMLWLGLILIIAVLALEKYLKKRFWCRYICPQSLLLNICGLILPQRFQVRFERKKCTCPAKDRLCGKSCPLNLDPRSASAAAQRLQCTNCGDCVDACQSRGKALSMGFGKKSEVAPPSHTPPAGA